MNSGIVQMFALQITGIFICFGFVLSLFGFMISLSSWKSDDKTFQIAEGISMLKALFDLSIRRSLLKVNTTKKTILILEITNFAF